jgi:hypothetical protein
MHVCMYSLESSRVSELEENSIGFLCMCVCICHVQKGRSAHDPSIPSGCYNASIYLSFFLSISLSLSLRSLMRQDCCCKAKPKLKPKPKPIKCSIESDYISISFFLFFPAFAMSVIQDTEYAVERI